MDLIGSLTERVNKIVGLPKPCRIGYLNPADEDFCVFPLAGSRVVLEYMDGAKEQEVNFEFAMKSRNLQLLNNTLWLVQNELEQLDTLTSNNNSFIFEWIEITNKPFINQLDDNGVCVFLLDVKVKITTY